MDFGGVRKELAKHKITNFLVSQNSKLVFQYYQNSKATSSLAKLNSVTKSVNSALVGICLDRGLIPSVHTPITEYFADYLVNDPDPRKQTITIYHLLTMSAGFDWPEFGEWNYFAPMVFAKDITEFILGRDLISEPGTVMNYNSGCSHLLGAIVQQVTGQKAADFAQKELFKPLGITEYKWQELGGQSLTADGLKLKPAGLLKFGQLYLDGGRYNGQQLINPSWITESTNPYYLTYESIGSYGYQWWVSAASLPDGGEIPFYFALGYQGQYLIIVPSQEIVIAITARLQNTLIPLEIAKQLIAKMATDG